MEPDRDTLDCMKSLFQDSGFSVEGVVLDDIDDFATHLSQIQLKCPSVIIYDLGPPPTRLQLARWLRILDHPVCKDSEFIFVTTNEKLPLEPKGHKSFMMVMKPFNIENLVRTAGCLLAKKKGGQHA